MECRSKAGTDYLAQPGMLVGSNVESRLDKERMTAVCDRVADASIDESTLHAATAVIGEGPAAAEEAGAFPEVHRGGPHRLIAAEGKVVMPTSHADRGTEERPRTNGLTKVLAKDPRDLSGVIRRRALHTDRPAPIWGRGRTSAAHEHGPRREGLEAPRDERDSEVRWFGAGMQVYQVGKSLVSIRSIEIVEHVAGRRVPKAESDDAVQLELLRARPHRKGAADLNGNDPLEGGGRRGAQATKAGHRNLGMRAFGGAPRGSTHGSRACVYLSRG